MREFTKEEISLCKQVAEKHRKEVEARQYFYNNYLKKIQWSGEKSLPKLSWAIPLWTISDCLEFLREREWRSYSFAFNENGEIRELSIVHIPFKFKVEHQIIVKGKTLLEACLKAVLAVLEEAK